MGVGNLFATVHVLTSTCTFTFGPTKAEIFVYGDVIHHVLQASRTLHARDVTSSTHTPTQRFHVDERKTIQIRSVWTRFF